MGEVETYLRLGVDSGSVVQQVGRDLHLILLGGDVQRRVTVLQPSPSWTKNILIDYTQTSTNVICLQTNS